MNKRFYSILLVVTIVSSLWAQNNLSDINQIKRDKEYLYGEATLDKKEAALDLAYELLQMEIKNWATQNNPKISNLVASNIIEYVDTIILQRHNMVRAFAYVKISNLIAVDGKSMNVEVNQKESLVHQKVPEVPQSSANTTPFAPETMNNTSKNDVIERLIGVESFYDLENIIQPMKSEGKITDYGKYTTMKDPANCYLIIYDQNAKVVAILGKGIKERDNLKTGKTDSEINYHGCGAIWIKIKE